HRAAGLTHFLDGPNQEAPLRTLHHDDVGRVVPPGDRGLVRPLEVGAVEVAVGDLELDPVLAGLPRDRLALDQLSGERVAVGEREPYDVVRPEEAEAVDHDEAKEDRKSS